MHMNRVVWYKKVIKTFGNLSLWWTIVHNTVEIHEILEQVEYNMFCIDQ